jgi:hypothetical protein
MSNGRARTGEIATVSIVWSASGVIAVYWNPAIAGAHAMTMLGVQVTTIEVRDQVPQHVRDDIYSASDYESDDKTPVDSEPVDPPDTIIIDVDDLE